MTKHVIKDKLHFESVDTMWIFMQFPINGITIISWRNNDIYEH